jgi:hypothetical protein
MARHEALNHLQPLAADQLWPAHMPPTLRLAEVWLENGQAETFAGELVAIPDGVMREPGVTTPLDAENKYRWIGAAVTSEYRRLPADVHYGDYLESIAAAERQAKRIKNTDLQLAAQAAGEIAVVLRNREYTSNLRWLAHTIRTSGNIYVGYGTSGASKFGVAKLEDIAALPGTQGGRREPVAILRAADGTLGLKPRDRRARREIFIAQRPLRLTTEL